jgi:plastocyanin
MTKFVYNPLAVQPGGGNVVSSRTSAYNSGILVGGEYAPIFPAAASSYTLRFTRLGTYTIVCLVHPGMAGKVVVKGLNARVPSPARARATANAQMAAGFAKAAALESTKVPAGTVYAGIGGTETLLSFLPGSIMVKAGQSVKFEVKSPSEAHTVTFGPPSFLVSFSSATDFIPFAPGDPNQVRPFDIYGSDPPGADGSYTYTGATMHGDGTFSTPVLDEDSNTPNPSSATIKFTVPGTYNYVCLLHPFMTGTVVVTP